MWLPSSRLPPSGESRREASTSFALVVGRPSASRPQPSGIGLFQREAIVSLPTATVVVAMSRTNGVWRAAGAAKLRGLVPIMGFFAKVGTIATNGELVTASPIIPRSSAIIE